MRPGREAIQACLAVLLILPGASRQGPVLPGGQGEDTRTAPGATTAPPQDPTRAQPPGTGDCSRMIEEARALLDQDLYEDALDRAGAAVDRCVDDAAAHVVMADALYRRGDFDEAERHYRRGVALDDDHAGAHYGVGRCLRTLGRYGEAAAAFQKAASLAPDEPRYLRTLANHLAQREDVLATLRRYLEIVKSRAGEETARIGNVEALVALLEKAGDAPLSQMERSETTSLPLKVAKGQPYIRIDVNGVDRRRFVFDTGATGMTVSPRLARKAGLEPIRPFTIAGSGAGRLETGTLVLIDRIAVGDGILLRHVPATVRDSAGPEDGLIGPSLFARMRIVIDMKGGTLSFTKPDDRAEGAIAAAPAPANPRESGGADVPPAAGERRVEPFRNVGGEIFVPLRVNDVPLNAMLDTGSASTIIGRTTVARLPELQAIPGQWFVGTTLGVGGPLGERRVILTGTIGIAGREFPADGLLSGDLGGLSRSVESEVYAILGVPHLDDFILTIDYAAMTVTFETRS